MRATDPECQALSRSCVQAQPGSANLICVHTSYLLVSATSVSDSQSCNDGHGHGLPQESHAMVPESALSLNRALQPATSTAIGKRKMDAPHRSHLAQGELVAVWASIREDINLGNKHALSQGCCRP